MNCDPKALLAAAKCYQCVPKAVWGPTVISLLCEWSNNMAKCTFQEGAGSPVGAAVPKFIGQLYYDTTGHVYYRSTGTTNLDWVLVSNAFVSWSPPTEIATWTDSGGAGQMGDYPTFLATADLNSLSSLDLSNTATTSIVATNCPMLQELLASSCTGPLVSVDATNCTAIHTINCAYNANLTNLVTVNCVSLSLLRVSYTGITALDVHGLTNLIEIQYGYCPSLVPPNLTGCVNLVTFFCQYSNITALDVSTCISLIALPCANNSMNPAAVDTVLCDLDANGLNGGTVDIRVNSIPTAVGLACSASLIGKSWSVNHD